MFANSGPLIFELSVSGLLLPGFLAGILFAAVWQDLRTRRIPNGVVVFGMIFGTCWHALVPGGLGPFLALAGLIVGLVLFLPLYLMRAMGAGDVKLMAMVGAFLGPADAFGAVLGTFLAGGVLAIAVIARRRLNRGRFLQPEGINSRLSVKPSLAEDVQDPASRLPYALAIAMGTLGYLGWRYASLPVY